MAFARFILIGSVSVLLLYGFSTAASTAGPIWAWMRSRAAVPRAFRLATAIFLLSLAGLDQTRYAFVVHNDDLRSMQKAAVLNPFDASLELRLAKKEADAGRRTSNGTIPTSRQARCLAPT